MGPELATLLGLVQTSGALTAPVFALLWWLERAERQAVQLRLEAASKAYSDDLRLLNKDSTAATNAAANSIGDMRVYMGLNRQERGRLE